MTFRVAVASLVALLVLPPTLVEVVSLFVSFPADLADKDFETERIVDRHGQLLREVRRGDGSKPSRVTRDETQTLSSLLVAVEDRHFYSHHGVDWMAVGRAVVTNLTHARIVSGASTITMQLARTVSPARRSLFGKIHEAAVARVIERHLSKDDILLEYENRVSFGPNLRGAGAAAHAYFDKPLAKLSLGETALLAGIVRGPSFYDLASHGDRAIARRARVLHDYRELSGDKEAIARAESEPLMLQSRHSAFGAPHFVRALLGGKFGEVSREKGVVVTTIDSALQRGIEGAALGTVVSLRDKHVTAASALVVDNDTGDILAYVGSANFFDEGALGQNDGVLAKRQPGSTLKPFLYELAMETRGFTPATLLPDVELHISVHGVDFSPKNYDGSYHGPVLMRTALGSSLNIPAVHTIQEVGVPAFLDRLHALGFSSLTESPDTYGPSLALGDGEVTLVELVRAYATLARHGRALPLAAVRGAEPPEGELVLKPVSVARTTDVLRDKGARYASFGERNVLEFPFDVAAKTGTSKGYRDNWAVGFTEAVTVGVWVGNFDGSAMDDVSGITGAGPLFHRAMELAMQGREREPLPIARGANPEFERVDLCALSGGRATASCRERHFEWLTHEEAGNLGDCSVHARIAIDRRNGLRAASIGTDQCPKAEIVERDVEQFGAQFLGWAKSTNRALPPDEYSPDCPLPPSAGDVADRPLRIDYPKDGAAFVIDPDRAIELQEIEVEGSGGNGARRAKLFVDGLSIGDSARPFRFPLLLTQGSHVLELEADAVRSAKVTIGVR